MLILVAINPRSGGGKGKVNGGKVRAHLQGSHHEVVYVEESSLISTLKEIEKHTSNRDFQVLVCVGGDGFIHDLIPVCIASKLELLVIPAGTGNDFSRTNGTHGTHYKKLLESLDHSVSHSVNLGSISYESGNTSFVQILSTGFDATVNERANNFKLIRGKFKYVVAVLLEVWKFKAIDFQVRIDEENISSKAMLVCVANGNSYGGGMKVVPHAKHDDGILDVMVLEQMSPIRLLFVFPKVFMGKHVNHPKLRFYSGKKIRISGDTWAFADGEKISHLPIEISISADNLLVYK